MKICAFAGCDREARCKGLCKAHALILYRTGELRPLKNPKPVKKCIHNLCNKQGVAKGYCNTHYLRFIKHGDSNVCAKSGRKVNYGRMKQEMLSRLLELERETLELCKGKRDGIPDGLAKVADDMIAQSVAAIAMLEQMLIDL